jgi:UPF0755 protein
LRRLLRLVLVLLLAAGVLLGAAAAWAWRELARPFQGFAGDAVTVEVASGSSAREILAQLESAGVLRSALLARLYLVHVLGDPPLQAGEYEFRGETTAHGVLEKLARGDVVMHSVTIVEGLTLEETAATLSAAGRGETASFLAAMRDPQPIADLDPRATDLEGYLLPDTYSFPRSADEAAIVAAIVRAFHARHAAEIRPLLDPAAPANLREVVTLASIVEKEARLDEERPRIASVYRNRLRIGMGLYADPTIIFALKKRGVWDGNLRRRDLELDDPYNTYRFPGLPPGPICSPGIASLRAAAAPETGTFLYFVSRNDGSHVFASTLAEHNRNVERWQRQYWRERWAQERSRAANSH